MGGEPLTSPLLHQYVRYIRDAKMTDRLWLFTNGLLLNKTSLETLNLFTRICVSVYPLDVVKSRVVKNNIAFIKRSCPSVEVVACDVSHFSQGNLIEKNNDSLLVAKIYNECYGKSLTWCGGRLYRCTATRGKYKVLLFHANGIVKNDFKHLLNADSLKIRNTLTENRLRLFINSRTPLQACSWCLGTSSKPIPHQQSADKMLHIATIDDLDFEAGRRYVSKTISDWVYADVYNQRRPEDDEYFNHDNA